MGLRFGDPDLFGVRPVIGSSSGDMLVQPIPKDEANAIIKAGHYSKSVVWSSNIHIGVFFGGRMIGVMQFGPAMNPASGGQIVAGAAPDQWTELNRMWLSEDKPVNAGSCAIGCAMRFIRKTKPKIEWVQSFADGRCGKLGAVYQASNFIFCGSHETTFYELDGEWFHKSMVGRGSRDKRGWTNGPKIARLSAGIQRAVPHKFRQYRYLFFLNQRSKDRLLLPVLPYPKPEAISA